MSEIRPFSLSHVRRMTRAQVALEAAMVDCFAGRPLSLEFSSELSEILRRYLKESCAVALSEMKTVKRGDLERVLPSVGCLLVIGAAPSERKIIVELDMSLAALAVDRLLGGTGSFDRILRPLTDIEEGILSFLVLKILMLFHAGLHTGNEIALSLDGFASKLDDVLPAIEGESDFVMLGVRVSVGHFVGYTRILLPSSVVTDRFGHQTPFGELTPAQRSSVKALLNVLSDVPILGRVEIALLPDLTAEDMADLEIGDIILVENHEITQITGGIEGKVFVRLGNGNNGGLRCQIVNDEKRHLQVVEIVPGEAPLETEANAMEENQEDIEPDGPADEETPEEDVNLEETEGLLRDISTPVVIELGRLRMNAAQLVRLHKGQMLRLSRGVNDPVDLVVNGKLFARGELIEVDGELGIRVMQIMGAS